MPRDRAAPCMPKLLDIQVVRIARCRGSLNKILWGSSRTRPATVASFKQEVARAKVSILAASNAKLCAKKGLLLQITQFALSFRPAVHQKRKARIHLVQLLSHKGIHL